MGRLGVWALIAAGIGWLGLGCAGPCPEVADLLRKCCERGPAELRSQCEHEAKLLDDDGNSKACQSALDQGLYARCVP